MARVAVVTGASAGVGRATVRELAERGWDVGLVARGHDRLDATRREVEASGRRALVLPADVADARAIEDAAGRVEAELGPIDAWVNNAMVSVFSPIRELQAAEVRRVTEVTYLGYVHGTLSALARMLPRDRGVIVQVGSALAYRAIPLQSAYCAAKHAIEGFTESLRTELIHDRSGVRVTTVHLPAVNTPQFDWEKSRLRHKAQPVPPIFQPEVAARAIAHAIEHPRREYLLGRSTILAVWGNKVAPGLLDRYLASTGYESQQTDELEDPGRDHNLWEPVPGDVAARGRFDDRAASWSPTFWLGTHLPAVGVAAVLGATAVAGIALGAGRRRER
jgi:short-subunit dehydrogenase